MPDRKESAGERVHATFSDPSLPPGKRYALLAVGTTQWSAVFRYEVLMLACSGLPGALGYWLRRKTYRSLFRSMGRNVTIGRNVTLRGGRGIDIGDDVFIEDDCVLDARGPAASIRLGKGVLVARRTILRARDGVIEIGDGSDIGSNCIVGTDSRVVIGRDVLIAAYAYVVGGGNHRQDDLEIPILRQGVFSKGGITIGDGVWLGARATVMDGVEIGEGTIVGAHALVNRALPPGVVAHGIPATVARTRSAGSSHAT
jgi:acetyltransferase-like isoleucine patch superfamily enzyme